MISAVSYPHYNTQVSFKGENKEETVKQKVERAKNNVPDVSGAIDKIGKETSETADSIKGAAGGAVAVVGSANVLANALKEPTENAKGLLGRVKKFFTKANGGADVKKLGITGAVVTAVIAGIALLKGAKNHNKKVATANAIKETKAQAELAEAKAEAAKAEQKAAEAKKAAAEAEQEAVEAKKAAAEVEKTETKDTKVEETKVEDEVTETEDEVTEVEDEETETEDEE